MQVEDEKVQKVKKTANIGEYRKQYYLDHKEKLKGMIQDSTKKRRENVEQILQDINSGRYKRTPTHQIKKWNLVKNAEGLYEQQKTDETNDVVVPGVN